jgi:homocysteine S-methyltransferase
VPGHASAGPATSTRPYPREEMGENLRTRLTTGVPVLLDGGLATTLEAAGTPLPGPLWSAQALVSAPAAVEAAHRAFVDAGAEVVLTASYQLSALGLRRAGLEASDADGLFRRSVELARRAAETAPHPVWVAGSLGPYGAALADGSEYTGSYDLSPGVLHEFHAPRVDALLAAGVDVVAFETVPAGAEVEVIAEVLRGTGCDAWISVTVAGDGTRTPRGEPLDEALAPALEVDEALAVGVNCCPPRLVAPALRQLAPARRQGRALLAKPNAGARWDPVYQSWRRAHESVDPAPWLAAGARLVGGCCGTGPEDLAVLARQVRAATRV